MKMYRVPLARAWWPAVGPRLERRVRQHCADCAHLTGLTSPSCSGGHLNPFPLRAEESGGLIFEAAARADAGARAGGLTNLLKSDASNAVQKVDLGQRRLVLVVEAAIRWTLADNRHGRAAAHFVFAFSPLSTVRAEERNRFESVRGYAALWLLVRGRLGR